MRTACYWAFAICASVSAIPVGAAPPTLPELLNKNACSACHSVDQKVIGPSFKEVAAKYRGDKTAPAKLAAKVKAGGSGVWGSMPMPPQAAIKDEDLKLILQQILALK